MKAPRPDVLDRRARRSATLRRYLETHRPQHNARQRSWYRRYREERSAYNRRYYLEVTKPKRQKARRDERGAQDEH